MTTTSDSDYYIKLHKYELLLILLDTIPIRELTFGLSLHFLLK